MNDPIRTFAEKAVTTARLAAAFSHFALASAFGLCGLYLFIVFQNWFAWGFAILFALVGLEALVKASEAYVSARPAERPDERQRYFESRSLYLPGDPVKTVGTRDSDRGALTTSATRPIELPQ